MFYVNIDVVWSNVDRSGGPGACWPWTKGCFSNGYGKVSTKKAGKSLTYRAHRVIYFLANGPFDSSLFVCHRCDVPICCNPSHLFLGTHLENLADMKSKGRSLTGDRNSSRVMPERYPKGEQRPQAKLTAADVAALRQRHAETGESHRALADRFGISRRQVNGIVNGRSWKGTVT